MPSFFAIAAAGLLITVLLTALSVYASIRTAQLFLPIPRLSEVLSILLPGLSYATLFLNRHFKLRSRLLPLVTGTSYTVPLLATLLATLSFADLRPESFECLLRTHWTKFYSASRGSRSPEIRRIQNAFECCGFTNTRDMAEPRQPGSCEELTGRKVECKPAWSAEERSVLGIMAAVGLAVLILQALHYWLNPAAHGAYGDSRPAWSSNGPRPLGVGDASHQRFVDNVDEEVQRGRDEQEQNSSTARVWQQDEA